MPTPEPISQPPRAASRELRTVRGSRVVVAFVVVTLSLAAVFIVIQVTGRGAAERNRRTLSLMAALKDLEEGRAGEAVAVLTPLVESEDFPSARGWRGEAYLRLGEIDKALLDFDAAARIEPNEPAVFAGRGVALTRAGEPAQALEDFNRALALREANPDGGLVQRRGSTLASILLARAEALDVLNRPDDAARDRVRASELVPPKQLAQ